jgi:deoxycytidylate deaminase
MEVPNPSFEYPFIHPVGKFIYQPADNEFMQIAKAFAREHSLDKAMPNASVIVKDGEVIAMGANGSTYHDNNECERVKRGIPTGQGYELCEGCHPKNHSEQTAILEAKSAGIDTAKTELYLWGHWWCCEPCWNEMVSAGITTVHLLEVSEILFNREADGNIIGRQFEAT